MRAFGICCPVRFNYEGSLRVLDGRLALIAQVAFDLAPIAVYFFCTLFLVQNMNQTREFHRRRTVPTCQCREGQGAPNPGETSKSIELFPWQAQEVQSGIPFQNILSNCEVFIAALCLYFLHTEVTEVFSLCLATHVNFTKPADVPARSPDVPRQKTIPLMPRTEISASRKNLNSFCSAPRSFHSMSQ